MAAEPGFSRTSRPWLGRIAAVVAASSVTLAACGSEDAEPVAEPSDITHAPPRRDAPQFGASLEEWAEAVEADTESSTEPESTTEIELAPLADRLGVDLEALEEWADADGASTESPTDPESGTPDVGADREGYEEVTWQDLLPPGYDNDAIFARYEDRLAELPDGSPLADEIYAEMQAEYEANSGAINEELDGAQVSLAGFVAPLNFDDDIITEFLLVPYFGACIHVPAPPPNQTVLVRVDKANGLTFDESWGPVWVAGTLTVEAATTDLATVSYTMTDATSGVYDEFE